MHAQAGCWNELYLGKTKGKKGLECWLLSFKILEQWKDTLLGQNTREDSLELWGHNYIAHHHQRECILLTSKVCTLNLRGVNGIWYILFAPVRKQTEIKYKQWLKMNYFFNDYEFIFPFIEPSSTLDICFLLLGIDF